MNIILRKKLPIKDGNFMLKPDKMLNFTLYFFTSSYMRQPREYGLFF